jgi:HK97 family phage portal protein
MAGQSRLRKLFSMRWTRGGTNAWNFFSGRSTKVLMDYGRGDDYSVVMAPLLWIQRNFPEAPWLFERRTGEEWESDEAAPIMDLLERPNEYYNGELLLWALIADYLLDGNAYVIKARNSTRQVTELWWAPSAMMEPKWPDSGLEFISHYNYTPNSALDPDRLEVEDVIHLRYGMDSAYMGRKGISPLRSAMREVMSDAEAADFSAGLLRNTGVPGIVFSPAGDAAIPEEEFDEVKQSLIDKFTGLKRGEPLVTSAATTVTQFGFSPQQMDLRLLRKLPEERVTAVLGVAAIVAGLGAGLDRSTFANYAEAREASTENCLIPLQRAIGSAFMHSLVPDFETDIKACRLRFDHTQMRALQEDQNALTTRKLAELSGGAITLAEYRRETGREADETMEVYLRAMNIVEVPAPTLGIYCETCGSTKHTTEQHDAAQAANPFAGPAAPTPASSDPTPPGDGTGEPPKSKQKAASRANVHLMETLLEHVEHLSELAVPDIRSFFHDLGERAALAYAAVEHPKARKAHESNDADKIMAHLNIDELFKDVLIPVILRHHTRVFESTVGTVNEMLGLSVDLPDWVARDLLARGGKRIGLYDIEKQTHEAIFRSLVDGRVLGESVEDLARRIRTQVPAGPWPNAGSGYRAKLIARTETKWAQNVSAMAAYKEAGADRLMAFDAQGADSDPECEARDGQIFSHAEAEAELANEHPNGTLSFAPVFD